MFLLTTTPRSSHRIRKPLYQAGLLRSFRIRIYACNFDNLINRIWTEQHILPATCSLKKPFTLDCLAGSSRGIPGPPTVILLICATERSPLIMPPSYIYTLIAGRKSPRSILEEKLYHSSIQSYLSDRPSVRRIYMSLLVRHSRIVTWACDEYDREGDGLRQEWTHPIG